MASPTALQDLLNRLGGRQQGPPAAMDLVTCTPHHLPLVEATCDHAAGTIGIRAVNIALVMAEREGDEAAVVDELAQVVARGRHEPQPVVPGRTTTWATADARAVARQVVQWAMDHPEHGAGPQVFAIARAALAARGG